MLTYNVTFKTDDAAHRAQLVQGLENVVKRRMEARKIEGAVASVVPTGEAATLTISNLNDEATKNEVTDLLAEPFSFDLRTTTVTNQSSEPSLDDWEKTSITGEDLTWVEVLQDEASGHIGIELTFTEDGRQKLNAIMKEHNDETLGIFVRDFLVSKLKIDGNEIKEHIIISGVPNANIARIFADDVNVGILTSLSLQ